MGVRGCGLGYDHHVPEVLPKRLAPIWYLPRITYYGNSTTQRNEETCDDQ